MARCLSHFFDTLQPNSVLKNGDWLRRPSEFFLIQEYGKVPVPLFQHAATKIRRERNWPILLAVWASFLLFGAIAAPVPGVNEPHYLSKSRHYWQPKWCERDFFLASPNAHSVFYATIGGLTQFGSFDQAAWAGRAISNFVLAWGWTQAFSLLFFTRWGPLWTAWLYLALAACGNFSGEWLVGGVEGKVLCYGFLLAALGEVLQHRPILAAMWAGLAVSFHPVVGLWGVLAFVLSQGIQHVWETKRLRRRQARDAADQVDPQVNTAPVISQPMIPSARLVLLSFGLFSLLALPGLIPVFQLLTESVSPETRYAGTYLQVYFRLSHHLDPMLFPARSYVCYTLIMLGWICSFQWGGRTNPKRTFDQIVMWSIVFAVSGIVIGWGPRPPQLMPFFAQRMQLLKFYPFRLADLLLPIALAVSLVSVLERSLLSAGPSDPQSVPPRSIFYRPAWLMLLVFIASLWRAHATTETNRYSLEDRADWLDVCSWIDRNLPPDALVQSPTNGWAFKWFARRAEYVAFKDCPQDAAGIVEWNRRLNFLQKWYEEKYADELYSAEELKELRRETGLTHLLTDRLGPLELEPVYRNATFQVYDLTTLD